MNNNIKPVGKTQGNVAVSLAINGRVILSVQSETYDFKQTISMDILEAARLADCLAFVLDELRKATGK